MDRLFLGVQSTSYAERLKNVVDPSEGESGMLGLNSLPMGIEFLGKGADPGLL
jgi:hypothetical protein